jgi:hypothetical protein
MPFGLQSWTTPLALLLLLKTRRQVFTRGADNGNRWTRIKALSF